MALANGREIVMDCREFRTLLRALSTLPVLALPEAASIHRASCAACDREARARTLLQLGSALSADQPRDGFEARLRARIAAEGGAPAVATWADAVGMMARPALGVAMLAMVAALAWSGWQSTRPSADDFALLADADGVLDSVLVDGFEDSATSTSTGTTNGTADAP